MEILITELNKYQLFEKISIYMMVQITISSKENILNIKVDQSFLDQLILNIYNMIFLNLRDKIKVHTRRGQADAWVGFKIL